MISRNVYIIVLLIMFITPTVHGLSDSMKMLASMGIMSAGQTGAAFANQAITAEFHSIGKALQQDQTNLTNSSKQFIALIENAQNQQFTRISDIFQDAQQHTQTLQQNQADILSSMSKYLKSILDLNNPPLQNYLQYPGYFDELFANGTMYTPQGSVWKNIFQVGDWQYDETTNSFWQMQNVPFLSSTNPKGITTPTLQKNAYKNSIGTEWYPKNGYEIECSITLYSVSYPFYAGIMFNKARWISGDVHGMQKYRTLGIYGDEQKNISLCFAQQYVQPSTTAKANSVPVNPIDQIYANQTAQKSFLTNDLVHSLHDQPVTLYFKIKPSPTGIEYKVWDKTAAQPAQYTTITLQNNQDTLFLYHGIGFISAGAIARFKLTSPTELVFSPTAIATFKTEIAQYIQKEQAKVMTSVLTAKDA